MWGFGSYEIGIAKDAITALGWWRIAYIGVIMIPVFFTNFIIAFLGLKRKGLLISLYALSAVFMAANLSGDYFIHEVSFSFNQFYYLSSPPFTYSAFIIAFLVMIAYGHTELLMAYKGSKGIKHSQIKYFLYAAMPSFTGGALEFLPVYGINIYPYLHIAIALSAFTVTYAIFRYRLMDIRIVIRKALIYFAAAAFSYAIFFAIAWAFENYFGGVFTSAAYLVGSILAPLFVIFLLRLYALVQKTADRYLFSDLYAHQQMIVKLSDQLTRSIDLSKILNLIVNDIKDAMKLDRAGVLLREERGKAVKYEVAKAVGFEEHDDIRKVGDELLARYLEKTQKPLVTDELVLLSEDPEAAMKNGKAGKLAESLQNSEVALCLPMIISGELIGMIVLGSRISGDAYSSEDLNALSTLTKQASVAVNNARLYKEVRDFSWNLEQKVDEQTREIRAQKDQLARLLAVEKRAHATLRRANEELRELDANKSDFMSITQHHLRTPLSINAGIVDLMLSGAYGKPPKEMKDVMIKLRDSNQKGIEVVNELLDISSYQMGKSVINLDKEIDFPALMEETLKDLRNAAQRKGLYLKYEQKTEIPKMRADRMKMKLVLTNVIDNCIKYTDKGGVTIAMKAVGGKLRIDIADTGIGLSAGVKKNLFKRAFSRGEEAQKMSAVGKGVGLFLSAKIVKGHHGKIWGESRADDEGSVFHIELPLKKGKN